MRLVSVPEMRAIETKTMTDYAIPSLILMENAGLQVAGLVRELLGNVAGKTILWLIGQGNNGGDGLVAARHLLNAGARTELFLLADSAELAPEAAANFLILARMGGSFTRLETADATFSQAVSRADLIVDAIFGTGFKGQLDQKAQTVIRCVNDSACPVLSVDVPSGLQADDGLCSSEAIRADYTLALGLAKIGTALEPAAAYVGRLIVADISLPQSLLAQIPARWHFFTEEDLLPLFLPRRPVSHKNDYGHVLVVGGSAGMLGAAAMASMAALRAGAGLVSCGIPRSLLPILQGLHQEIMVRGWEETADQHIAQAARPQLEQAMRETDVCLLGPGMGRYPEAAAIVRAALLNGKGPLIIDADGLNALAGQTDLLRQCARDVILTPHPGEMSRLTGMTPANIQQNQFQIARRCAEEWGVTLVLKGHRAVTAAPTGEVFVNSTGNAGMATGGSGDVLAGIIAGLLAQGLSAARAAAGGVYLHGRCGDLAAERCGQRALIAGDIIAAMAPVWAEAEKKAQLTDD